MPSTTAELIAEKNISRTEFDEILENLFQKETWILDGDYSRTMKLRMQMCDTVVLFAVSFVTCMQGIKERAGSVREDIPWDVEKADDMLLNEVKRLSCVTWIII